MFIEKLFTCQELKHVVSAFKLQCLPRICSEMCFSVALAALHNIVHLVITLSLQSSLIVSHQRALNRVVIFQFGLAFPLCILNLIRHC